MIAHSSDRASFEQDGTGFYAATCSCGWRSGYLPDLETVCDALMEHAAAAAADELQPVVNWLMGPVASPTADDLQNLEVKAPGRDEWIDLAEAAVAGYVRVKDRQ